MPVADTMIKTASPLDGLAGPKGRNVRLEERRELAKVSLRGDPADKKFLSAVKKVTGSDLPLEAGSVVDRDGYIAHWVGPDEWLIHAAAGSQDTLVSNLRNALDGIHSSVVDVSDYYVVIRISGPNARDVLAKGCVLDLHPRAFPVGKVAGTLFANATVVLRHVDDGPTYDVQVRWSYADYLWNYFVEGAREYG